MKLLWIVVFLLFQNAAVAFQSVAILPFSNRSEKEEVYWLGEGFAESLSEELLLSDVVILKRRQKVNAYEDLHIPYSGDLSRATMLKIADKLSADYIIFGSYKLNGTNLEVETKVIQTSTSRLSAAILAVGSLDGLYQVQMALKAGLEKYFAVESIRADAEKAFPAKTVPLHAYELYIKGLMEDSDAERIKFLQSAIRANPEYPQAAYRLAVSLFRVQRYRESSDALQNAKFEGTYKDRSDFLIALNSYYSGDFESAYLKWLELSKSQPTSEVYNNIGIALMKKSDPNGAGWYLSKAAELHPEQADYHFNLACSYVQRGYDRQAVQQYREAVSARPMDYEALYLIAKLLERDPDPVLKESISKRVIQYFQETLSSDQKGKFPEQYTSVGQLVRPAIQFLTQEERDHEARSAQKSRDERAGIVKAYENSAVAFLEKEDGASAILELKKGASLAPFGWFLHYLWGQSLRLQHNQVGAISELEFSIWCEDNVESHLMLAEIYKESDRFAESKVQVQRSLALDPLNKKALEIWGKIWDKQ